MNRACFYENKVESKKLGLKQEVERLENCNSFEANVAQVYLHRQIERDYAALGSLEPHTNEWDNTLAGLQAAAELLSPDTDGLDYGLIYCSIVDGDNLKLNNKILWDLHYKKNGFFTGFKRKFSRIRTEGIKSKEDEIFLREYATAGTQILILNGRIYSMKAYIPALWT